MKIHSLLDPKDCVLLLVDYQPQMVFGVKSMSPQELINSCVGLAKSAQLFKVPVILTTIAAETFSGPVLQPLQAVLPKIKPIDRSFINCWQDKRVVDAVKKTKRKKVVIGGLWTEACVAFPVIQMLEDGYEVYVIADACGGVSNVAHDTAMLRMIQAGAAPMTWLQFLLELQRDWARKETYDGVMNICKEHAGTYGVGIEYAEEMVSRYKK